MPAFNQVRRGVARAWSRGADPAPSGSKLHGRRLRRSTALGAAALASGAHLFYLHQLCRLAARAGGRATVRRGQPAPCPLMGVPVSTPGPSAGFPLRRCSAHDRGSIRPIRHPHQIQAQQGQRGQLQYGPLVRRQEPSPRTRICHIDLPHTLPTVVQYSTVVTVL